jgi:hypothetical protein
VTQTKWPPKNPGRFRFNLLSEYRSSDPHYHHIIAGGLFLLSSIVLAFLITYWVHLGIWPNLHALGWAIASAVFAAYLFGTWLGFSMLESKANDQDVFLKNETLNRAKLIMMMTHHTILYKDGVVYVVPTADINRVASPRHFPFR